jgi:thiol-disulfide isomerase/thioredoxin
MVRHWISAGSLGLALLVVATALAQEKKDAKSEVKPGAEKTADKSTAGDPYAVPEGPPKQLMEFIKNIIHNLPQDQETYKKARAAMLKAADKMLADNPSEDELDFAVEVKTHTLDKTEDITAFSEALKKAGHEKQSRVARSYALQISLRNALMSDKSDQVKKQITAVLNYLNEAPPQSADLGLAIMAGQIAESVGDNAYALDVYGKLSKVFGYTKDERLAEFGQRLDGVVRRLSLLGKKMELEGKLLSGEAFDFWKYQGKVVLIDFWVSWRQSCAAEVPKLKAIYEKYHDKGFDIVGFGCDYRREDVEKFVQENGIPWATVYGDKGPSLTFEYYGVMSFPMAILIGKDGKVKQLNVDMAELDKELDKLLGPAGEKK